MFLEILRIGYIYNTDHLKSLLAFCNITEKAAVYPLGCDRQSRDLVLRGLQSSFCPGICLFQIRSRKSRTVSSWLALSAKLSKALSANWDAGLPGTGESPGLSSPWPQEIQLILMTCGACQPELDTSQRLKKPRVFMAFHCLWSHLLSALQFHLMFPWQRSP